eukprot:2118996-Rhodomonas_salina.1
MGNQPGMPLPTGAMPFTPSVPQQNMAGAKQPVSRRYTQMSFGGQPQVPRASRLRRAVAWSVGTDCCFPSVAVGARADWACMS